MPENPYECVIAENLIAIEWELLQHRRMRDVGIQQLMRDVIREAVIAREKDAHERKLDEVWEEHVDDGGDEDDWNAPFEFDDDAAHVAAEDLARRATSPNRGVQAEAYTEIAEMGLEPVEVMAEAYRALERCVLNHENRLPGLEQRRRAVQRDYAALQKHRPVDIDVIEA